MSSSDLRDLIVKDDSSALASAIRQGLDPKTWLDLDSRDALIAIAVTEGSLGCLNLLLREGGDLHPK